MYKPGDQILYIPSFILDIEAPTTEQACLEFGFVTSVNEEHVFCRFWTDHRCEELRTTSTSESVNVNDLIPYTYLSSVEVEEKIFNWIFKQKQYRSIL